MPERRMNSSWRSKMVASSASKPTTKLAYTSIPWAYTARRVASGSARLFCSFSAPASASRLGVSRPMNTHWNRARRSWSSRPGGDATLADTSAPKVNRYRCRRWYAARKSSNSRQRGRWPIRLSSMKKTLRTPWARSRSSSRSTWASAFARGLRPKVTMMSQNSQRNGQPRENWIATDW